MKPALPFHHAVFLGIPALNKRFSIVALIDSGSASSFIDQAFCDDQGIPLEDAPEPLNLRTIDGTPIKGGCLTKQTAELDLWLSSSHEKIRFYVAPLSGVPLLLGLPWLKAHNPLINWRTEEVALSPQTPPQILRPRSPQPSPTRSTNTTYVSATTDRHIHDPLIRNTDNLAPMVYVHTGPKTCRVAAAWVHEFLPTSAHETAIIQAFNAADAKTYDLAEGGRTDSLCPYKYRDFADVFDEQESRQLPPHRPYDCAIELQPGSQAPWGPVYNMSPAERELTAKYVQDQLQKGFIRPSKSPASSPVLFAPKPGGGWRFCVDYRKLNEVTIKNRYPIPLIDELLESVNGATLFTKIDLRAAYNLLRIQEGDEWKTAFRCFLGLFEYLVMPFGLANGPAIFQQFLNEVFHDLIGINVVVYLDDILVYTRPGQDHAAIVRDVLTRLRTNHLFADLGKCEFETNQTTYLGFVISPHGITMDPQKVSAVRNWQPPKTVKGLQSFLGFANFYRRFIRNYSRIAAPLTYLTRKDVPFEWTTAAQNAFDTLKDTFTSAPILRHADPSLPFFVEADASDFAIGAVLSQADHHRFLHPVAFYSRKMTSRLVLES